MLSLAAVSKSFGPRLIFRGVDLTVRPSSVILLAGPNGAGKTTLLRIMAGLLKPDSGKVSCDLPQEKLGFLGHPTFIYPGLSALENLEFWAGIQGQKLGRAELLQALARVRLERFAHDRAGIFSRGMAQRLNLARLLLPGPDLLLLDEPGTGLDVHSRGLLRASISEARARGAAVVWISHDVTEDRRLADAVLWLHQGRLRDSDPEDDAPGQTAGDPVKEAQPC